MIGAVCYKVTSEYTARIYLVGTYDQIDWTHELPCILGEKYVTVLNASNAANITLCLLTR